MTTHQYQARRIRSSNRRYAWVIAGTVILLVLIALALRGRVTGVSVLRSIERASEIDVEPRNIQAIAVTPVRPEAADVSEDDVEVIIGTQRFWAPRLAHELWLDGNRLGRGADAASVRLVFRGGGDQEFKIVREETSDDPMALDAEADSPEPPATTALRLNIFDRVWDLEEGLTRAEFVWSGTRAYTSLNFSVFAQQFTLSVMIKGTVPPVHEVLIADPRNAVAAVEGLLRGAGIDPGLARPAFERLWRMTSEERWRRILAFDAARFANERSLSDLAEGAFIALTRVHGVSYNRGLPSQRLDIMDQHIYITASPSGSRFSIIAFDARGACIWEGHLSFEASDPTPAQAAEVVRRYLAPRRH